MTTTVGTIVRIDPERRRMKREIADLKKEVCRLRRLEEGFEKQQRVINRLNEKLEVRSDLEDAVRAIVREEWDR